MKHESVIDGFRKAAKSYDVEEKVNLMHDGAYLFYKMTFPKVEMEPVKGDIVRLQMIVRNSYNAKRSLQVIFGALRLVCLNGMVLGAEFMKFEYRHIGDIAGKNSPLTGDEYQSSIKHYVKVFAENGPKIADMAKHKLAEPDGYFKKDYLHLPEYLRKESELGYRTGTDKTTWGYYNALTSAVTHKMRKENAAQQIKFGARAWDTAVKTLQ